MGRASGRLAAAALVGLALLAGCRQVTNPGAAPGSQPLTTGAVSASSSPVPSVAAPPRGVDPVSGLRWVPESALPPQARQTLALIRAGGPYPYPRSDDQTFGNREGRLPAKPASYYKEYTVVTPGQPDRGPRRIIAGQGGERYYTEDHYESFRRIKEGG